MKIKRLICLTLSSALAFLLVSAMVPLSRSQTATPAMLPVPQPGTVLPEAATPCLETTGKTFEVVGTQSEQDKTFHYLHTWLYGSEDDFESWYSLIQVDPSGCRRLKGVRSGLKPLSSFMTMAVARQLELQRYRREIARAGGKQPFEQRLKEKLSPPAHSAYSGVTVYLSQEQVWALQQLGIRFPKTYKLLNVGGNSPREGRRRMKRLFLSLMAIVLLGLVYLGVKPALSKPDGTWQRMEQAAPTKLLQQLRQDYAPYLRSDTPVEVGQMQMLKLQQPGALPLYLINTRVHPKGQPEQTPTCGTDGCLFLGYLPDKDGFKPVLQRWINDFRVQGAQPVIQPTERVLNQVPCFQLTPYNSRTQKNSATQTLCFNSKDFVPAGEEPKQSFHPRALER